MKVSFLDKEVRPTRRQWFMARKGYWGMGLMKNTYSIEEKILNKPWILLLGWTPQSIVFYGPYLYLLGRWRLKDFCSQEFLRPSLHYSFCFILFLAMCFLQRASLVAQLVKNPPAIWETWVRSLGWEDPLEKGMATHSSILAWRIPRTV